MTTAALTTFTRTVDLSGQSNGTNPGNLDPLFYPPEGAALTTLTYTTFGSQIGININPNGDASAYVWLMTAIPLAAWNDNAAAQAQSVVVEWEQNLTAGSGEGGLYLYHFSKGLFSSDKSGYYIRWQNSSTDWALYTVNGSGTFTQVSGSPITTTATNSWERYRCTISKGTGTTKTFLLEHWNGSSYVTISNANWNNITSQNTMFGVAWRNLASQHLQIRGPNGAAGPKVTFLAPPLVVAGIGQSELAGRATGTQSNFNFNLYAVTRDGTFQQLADPWAGSAVNATWTGVAADTGAAGGFICTLANDLTNTWGTQAWHGMDVLGGTSASDHAPPLATNRYNTATQSGAGALMSTILAGDGRQSGMTFLVLYFQGTRDAVLGTAQATYENSVKAIFDRQIALFPAAKIFMDVQGDRTYAAGATVGSCNAIRAAQQDLVSTVYDGVKQLFDDVNYVGAVGTGTGWPDGADAASPPLHPGKTDNDALSAAAFASIVPPVGSTGSGLSGLSALSALSGIGG
jgi:hypothetical protein